MVGGKALGGVVVDDWSGVIGRDKFCTGSEAGVSAGRSPAAAHGFVVRDSGAGVGWGEMEKDEIPVKEAA